MRRGSLEPRLALVLPAGLEISALRVQFPKHPNRELFAAYGESNRAIREIFALIRERGLGSRLPVIGGTEDRCAYSRPGALPVNPARRNASAIASPLAGTELLARARVSAGRTRLSDPVGAVSARAMVGRTTGA